MLQRYDISMDGEANRLLIKEFAVLGQKTRKREYFEPTSEKYLFIHKVTYDGDIIRGSDEFFPIRSCVEVIVERVIELFKDNSDSFSEVIFDDQFLLSKNVE